MVKSHYGELKDLQEALTYNPTTTLSAFNERNSRSQRTPSSLYQLPSMGYMMPPPQHHIMQYNPPPPSGMAVALPPNNDAMMYSKKPLPTTPQMESYMGQAPPPYDYAYSAAPLTETRM